MVEEGVRGMTTLPTWGVVLLALAGPIVALVALVVGWLSQRGRQEHERKLQSAELEDRRLSKLREERIRAYAAFYSLARGAAATRHRPTRPVTQIGGRTALENLREARATVVLLRETPELEKAVQDLYGVCKLFLDGQEPAESNKKYHDARKAFLEWARYELGLRSQPPGS
jgi:hypothetical protein